MTVSSRVSQHGGHLGSLKYILAGVGIAFTLITHAIQILWRIKAIVSPDGFTIWINLFGEITCVGAYVEEGGTAKNTILKWAKLAIQGTTWLRGVMHGSTVSWAHSVICDPEPYNYMASSMDAVNSLNGYCSDMGQLLSLTWFRMVGSLMALSFLLISTFAFLTWALFLRISYVIKLFLTTWIMSFFILLITLFLVLVPFGFNHIIIGKYDYGVLIPDWLGGGSRGASPPINIIVSFGLALSCHLGATLLFLYMFYEDSDCVDSEGFAEKAVARQIDMIKSAISTDYHIPIGDMDEEDAEWRDLYREARSSKLR